MPFEVHRVIAANDAAGKAVVVTDERSRAISRGIGENITGCEMWSTDRMPVDNSTAADAPQRAGYVKHYLPYNYVGNGQGTTFRITEWAPDHARFTHRTQTVDYDVVLSGEFDLEGPAPADGRHGRPAQLHPKLGHPRRHFRRRVRGQQQPARTHLSSVSSYPPCGQCGPSPSKNILIFPTSVGASIPPCCGRRVRVISTTAQPICY